MRAGRFRRAHWARIADDDPLSGDLASPNARFLMARGGQRNVALGRRAGARGSSAENSNLDLADAFTRMIVKQRAYNSAAKVVRTIDQMTETVADLKRRS